MSEHTIQPWITLNEYMDDDYREIVVDLALKHLEPDIYEMLVKKINTSRDEREAYIKDIADPIYTT